MLKAGKIHLDFFTAEINNCLKSVNLSMKFSNKILDGRQTSTLFKPCHAQLYLVVRRQSISNKHTEGDHGAAVQSYSDQRKKKMSWTQAYNFLSFCLLTNAPPLDQCTKSKLWNPKAYLSYLSQIVRLHGPCEKLEVLRFTLSEDCSATAATQGFSLWGGAGALRKDQKQEMKRWRQVW